MKNQLNNLNKDSKKKFIYFSFGCYKNFEQEFNSIWLNKIKEHIYDDKIVKVFYLIDEKYEFNDFADNHIYKFKNKFKLIGDSKFYKQSINNTINAFINHNYNIKIFIIANNFTSSYHSSKIFEQHQIKKGILCCEDSVPKKKHWIEFEFFLSKINNSEIGINNHVITNSRIPMKINNKIQFRHVTIGRCFEHISELGYIIINNISKNKMTLL